MKDIKLYDLETNEIIAQISEDEDGAVYGVVVEGFALIVDGTRVEQAYGDEIKEEEIENFTNMLATPCPCGADIEDLDIVKTVVTYADNDVDIEYKLVCPHCKRESDLAKTIDGAVISWNENLIKEKRNDLH